MIVNAYEKCISCSNLPTTLTCSSAKHLRRIWKLGVSVMTLTMILRLTLNECDKCSLNSESSSSRAETLAVSVNLTTTLFLENLSGVGRKGQKLDLFPFFCFFQRTVQWSTSARFQVIMTGSDLKHIDQLTGREKTHRPAHHNFHRRSASHHRLVSDLCSVFQQGIIMSNHLCFYTKPHKTFHPV